MHTVFIVRPTVWERYQDCESREQADAVSDFLSKVLGERTYVLPEHRVPRPPVEK